MLWHLVQSGMWCFCYWHTARVEPLDLSLSDCPFFSVQFRWLPNVPCLPTFQKLKTGTFLCTCSPHTSCLCMKILLPQWTYWGNHPIRLNKHSPLRLQKLMVHWCLNGRLQGNNMGLQVQLGLAWILPEILVIRASYAGTSLGSALLLVLCQSASLAVGYFRINMWVYKAWDCCDIGGLAIVSYMDPCVHGAGKVLMSHGEDCAWSNYTQGCWGRSGGLAY